MPELGHVVFYVRDLDHSLAFYREVVGLDLVGRIFGGRGALLSGGRTHHELLLIGVPGEAPGPLQGRRIGLYHVAWKLGEDLDALRAARDRARAFASPITGLADHTVSRSLYLQDPDGNEVELYVDVPGYDWRRDRNWLEAPVQPLNL
jgi:catechol 2,3-dioxygenase